MAATASATLPLFFAPDAATPTGAYTVNASLGSRSASRDVDVTTQNLTGQDLVIP